MCNAELVNSDDRQPSSPSLNESQLQNHKANAISSLPPIKSEDNYDLSINHDLIDMTLTNPIPEPINSNHENLPESLIPQSSLDTTNLVNIGGSSNNTTNENGCAIAIQVDEDYEDEENEDEISETVALTQKFDKSRTKKN